MKLVFATNNRHKLDEVRKITSGYTEIVSLSEINCHEDIPETAETLEGNALQKARYIKEHFGYDCFADDTGLEVEALHNAPGVYSARYAGPGHDSEANMDKLLHEMENTYSQTFAEMGNDIKNQISHRAEAVKKLTAFLSNYTF